MGLLYCPGALSHGNVSNSLHHDPKLRSSQYRADAFPKARKVVDNQNSQACISDTISRNSGPCKSVTSCDIADSGVCPNHFPCRYPVEPFSVACYPYLILGQFKGPSSKARRRLVAISQYEG